MKASLTLLLSGLILIGSIAATGWWATGNPSSRPQAPLGAEAWASVVATIAPDLRRADVPALTAAPSEVAAFVERLTPRQRDDLVRLAPTTIGNLDGIPLTMRYAANESVLAETTTPTVEQALAVDAPTNTAALAPVRWVVAPSATPTDHGGRPRGIEMERTAGTGQVRPGRTLAYDPRGDGRVVQVIGDLERAKHIAVLVPGSSWRLDNVLRWPSGHRVSPLANALVLQSALGDDAAIVVWLGYDAPERVDLAAVGSARAIAGEGALRRFLNSLPDAHVSLLCHSYGSVVCGRALPGSPVDEVVAIGSPGMDVGKASDLRTTARVWAARTADDPIRITPAVRVLGLGHGTSPVNPKFGARVFRTGTATGHDQYYAEGTESLANIARIVLGHAGEVTLR
ncbi:alpha/beta hydrolase [Cryptosporangium sp. NPDC048952]|uniref:alpha/beta hydrolase n=1 Tax=Cryptosporangium sp. NPDC048952 TaxID=3363961 RepID=UPI00371ABEF3